MTRVNTIEAVVKEGQWQANGCSSYTFYNAGNVNVTIDNLLVLPPLTSWEGPLEVPGIDDMSVHDVKFDLTTVPTVITPQAGAAPASTVVVPGVPPARDTRLLIFKSTVK